jgi:hypothetical protein
MTGATVGRPKKPAAKRNYKINYDLLGQLGAIARLEDRSDTSQLERWIREGAERWVLENPEKAETYRKIAAEIQAAIEKEGE